MLVGPVFTREAITSPRRARMYISRAAYVAGLLVLACTAWMVLAGTQEVRNISDLARFGARLFSVLAPLQLALAVFFSAMQAASAVAHEKDRKTLILLLLTNLTNSELVLGKLLASMLNVLVLLASSIPLFMLVLLLGGVTGGQVTRVFAVTLVSALCAGSLGSTVALWREKTFQALALTTLAIVLWLVAWEGIAAGALGTEWRGISTEVWASAFSPFRAVLAASQPILGSESNLGPLGNAVNGFLLLGMAFTVAVNGLAIALVRVWNPSRELVRRQEDPTRASIWGAEYDLQQELAKTADDPASESTPKPVKPGANWKNVSDLATAAMKRREQVRLDSDDPAKAAARLPTREVWDNPVIWREIRTWCYGRKILVIKLAYAVLAVLAVLYVYFQLQGERPSTAALSIPLVLLAVVSLILVNAQAVTALTSERDAKALDLLLVTDMTPKEFVYGKLGGVFYNAKEMVIVPLALCFYLWYRGVVGGETLQLLLMGLLVLNAFVATVGIHAGMAYENSRQAIGVSLGTVFFLFLGVATCMRIMISFGSFELQFVPFSAMALGGGIGLYLALGSRNPSPAIALASLTCPFATFYAITSFFLKMPMAVFLVTVATYGFATVAMLIPAIFEFDVATGRTSGGED
ncbi:MAG: ABC transporter permease subunit [Pirellulales bacterium]